MAEHLAEELVANSPHVPWAILQSGSNSPNWWYYPWSVLMAALFTLMQKRNVSIARLQSLSGRAQRVEQVSGFDPKPR
jgi:hypothetical protein